MPRSGRRIRAAAEGHIRQENDEGEIQTHKHRCPGLATAC